MISQFTNNEKYAIVSVLSQIMNADGVIHPKEELFMDRVYEEFGIKINDVEELSNMNDIQARQILNNMSISKRDYAHSLFVAMAESDGYVHPKESIIIEEVFK